MRENAAFYVTKLSGMYFRPRPDQKNEDYEVTKSKLVTGNQGLVQVLHGQ